MPVGGGAHQPPEEMATGGSEGGHQRAVVLAWRATWRGPHRTQVEPMVGVAIRSAGDSPKRFGLALR
ncbi:leucine-rich repeat extensin-like protein 7 [Iris pallida]|uniref:Leucine-rich repeat extensin-like protein 7 n=1 Tax=Iris pallida TaxID=29817 RepID=A0AAX6EFQ8_IRIPA|nr:leucine-rich repeat extensin-like protein 7 [Iris pallida]